MTTLDKIFSGTQDEQERKLSHYQQGIRELQKKVSRDYADALLKGHTGDEEIEQLARLEKAYDECVCDDRTQKLAEAQDQRRMEEAKEQIKKAVGGMVDDLVLRRAMQNPGSKA